MFLMRGIGDYLATYFPGAVGRQVIKSIRSRPVRAVPAPAQRLL